MIRTAIILVASIHLLRGAPTNHPNVLFIAVDDLNHWVGHLGRNAQAKTPNIDRLARKGVTFTRAYCAAPVCNPSRTALMSGMRPSTTGVYDNGIDWRPHVARRTNAQFALPQSTAITSREPARSITAAADRIDEWDDYCEAARASLKPQTGRSRRRRHQVSAPLDCDDIELGDYRIASWIIGQLEREARQAVLPGVRIAQAAHAVERAEEVLRHVPLESIQLPPSLTNDLADVPPAA